MSKVELFVTKVEEGVRLLNPGIYSPDKEGWPLREEEEQDIEHGQHTVGELVYGGVGKAP